MKAEIISIGDELLIGQVIDTNTAWIGEQLDRIGVEVIRISSISDSVSEIVTLLHDSCQRADLVITTGGLGPTMDDKTKQAFCDFLKVGLCFNGEVYQNIEYYFSKRGKTVSEPNRKQALIPENCVPLKNNLGTAPGLYFRYQGKILVALPGVPYEMQALISEQVLPLISQSAELTARYYETVLTIGIAESDLSELLHHWEQNLPSNLKLAYLPSPGQVRLRISSSGSDIEKLKQEVHHGISELKELIGDHIFGYNNDTLQEVVGNLLRDKNKTLSIAESCTGGYLSSLITQIPGCSDYFFGSIISYSDNAKSTVLGISSDIVPMHGAVSEETVVSMAECVQKKFNTDLALAISGIAGPGGGTVEKPVGTVWIALTDGKITDSACFKFGDLRERNIHLSAYHALGMLHKKLKSDF